VLCTAIGTAALPMWTSAARAAVNPSSPAAPPVGGTSRSTGSSGVCNAHFANSLTFPIPGRGLALSWAPMQSRVKGGHALAVGGHLIGSQTYLPSGERYDTKLYDTSTGAYLKRFGVHYWWAVANTWTVNPFLGEVIADGAGDHAAKLFYADGKGTDLGPVQASSARGRYAVEDGALPGIKAVFGAGAAGLGNINAWITSLAFSPDGTHLAGSSKDGTIRIWQITDQTQPQDQFRVVKMYFNPSFGAALSVRWSPDGTTLAAGFKRGALAIYGFDPLQNRWDEDTIAAFSRVSASAELGWVKGHLAGTNALGQPLLADAPRWAQSGLGAVWNVRYSPDGKYLAAAANNMAEVFDPSGSGPGYPLGTSGHGLDFSPDGHYLAVGGADGHVYVFAETLATPPFAPYDRLQGHTEPVVGAVAWSPDGATLASVAGGPLLDGLSFNQSVEGNDDNVRLWVASSATGVSCVPVTTTTSTTTTTPASSTTSTTSTRSTSSTTTTTVDDGQHGDYPGFGSGATGGLGHPVFVVTHSADDGPGSLRDAFAKAKAAGGGTIHFAVTDSGDLHPGRNLIVPANTTVDATGSHITLWGGNEGLSNGVLNVWYGNVIVVGLRIRNGRNDGIQIKPNTPLGQDISDIVVDRCSLTGNADGGVDVTGYHGHVVSNLTIMRSFIAGSGRHCYKGLCGGGSLFKYGANNGSYYANFFFSNLERAPLISGGGGLPVVADLRYNLAEATQSSSMSVRSGGMANIVGNFFIGARDGAMVWEGGLAYFGGGNVDQHPSPSRELSEPVPVPVASPEFSEDDAANAGALPRDAIDSCYMALAAPSFSAFKASTCAITPSGDVAPGASRARRRPARRAR
jgi:WD40 repeat protein